MECGPGWYVFGDDWEPEIIGEGEIKFEIIDWSGSDMAKKLSANRGVIEAKARLKILRYTIGVCIRSELIQYGVESAAVKELERQVGAIEVELDQVGKLIGDLITGRASRKGN